MYASLFRWARRARKVEWTRPRRAFASLRWAALVAAMAWVGVTPFEAQGQLGGIGIGGGGGGVGRVGGAVGGAVSGNATTRAAVRAPSVGGTVSGATGGTVRVAPRVAPNVGAAAGGTARVAPRVAPNVGAAVDGSVRTAQRIQGNVGSAVTGGAAGQVRSNVGAASGTGANVGAAGAGAQIRSNLGAAAGTGANVGVGGTGAQVRSNLGAAAGTGANVGVGGTRAQVRGNLGAAAGTGANVGAAGTGAQIRSNLGTAAGAGANVGVGGTGAQVRTNVGAAAGTGAAVGAGAAGINAGANVRTALRPNLDANANVGTRFMPSWHGLTGQQAAAINANLRTAVAANLAGNIGMNNWIQSNPQRLAVWSGWGSGVRSNFYVGRTPFFGGNPFYTQNFWSGRNLIGLGLASAGYGQFGAGVGGYPMWWGYSPWSGYRPWNYWWGVPTWNGLVGYFPNYGWNQPYFYDYGTGGNVVYQGNQVLVNGQVVGTPSEYAQTAAALAAIDPGAIGQTAPEDWLPLGTFSLAVTQNEANPPRVAQLAINRQGLISGTVFNRNSDKLYTVQGRVDAETQRAAFTIGDQTDTILETGLYNLTQEQTPVLVHYGPSKTSTYLLARLPAPEVEGQAATQQNAAVTAPGINR